MPSKSYSEVDTAERLRKILNSAKDGIIALDPQGHIDGVNPAIEKMFGYREEELNGKGVGFLYEEEPTAEQVESFLAYIRSKGGETSNSKFQGRRKDGTLILCDVAVTPMHLSSGQHFVAIVRDITESSRIEQIKDHFVATVSHELRTPLTSIAGSLGLLVGGAAGELPQNALKLIKIAHSNSERLVRLINDILDIEKIKSGKMMFAIGPHPIVALLNQSIEGVAGFAERHDITIDLARGCEHVTVLADPDRLFQVTTNLLSNAIKFSPPGEAVAIRCEELRDACRISVINKGEGIPDEFRDRIFSRFAQADSSSTRAQGGTGLGLNIVQEIVTRLGGEVGFDSSPGEGATFYFTLPLAQKCRDGVLICTSGSDFRDDAMKLNELGVDVRFAQSIEEVRSLIADTSFSAVILDLSLSELFRADILHAIHSHAQNAPLVILAGGRSTGTGTVPLRNVLEWLDRPAPEIIGNEALDLSDPAPHGRILHVEDDEDILSLVSGAFGPEIELISARSIKEASSVLRLQRLDSVILDLKLGSENGLELLPQIRRLHPAVPVVIFSASDAEEGTGVKADAHFTKSRVSLEEVVNTVLSLISADHEVRRT